MHGPYDDMPWFHEAGCNCENCLKEFGYIDNMDNKESKEDTIQSEVKRLKKQIERLEKQL